MKHRLFLLLPLLFLLGLGLVLAWRLANPPDTVIHSKLEGQPLPDFSLESAVAGKPGLASADLVTGQPRILNLFASWCVPCIAEAPVLMELKRRGIAIDAIAIRDRPADIADFLASNGDPFQRIGSDPRSQVQLALGSSGVPESFVIDGRGVIRYQHAGPIMPQDLPLILDQLERAR